MRALSETCTDNVFSAFFLSDRMSFGLLTIDCWFKMTRGKMYMLSSSVQSHCLSRFATRFNCLLLAHALEFLQLVVEAGECRVFLEFLFGFGIYNLRTTNEQRNKQVGGWVDY